MDGSARALLLMSELAVALQDRHDRTSSLRDLEWAIELNTVALARRPPGHRDRWISLLNLCNALGNRYERKGIRNDMDRASGLLFEAHELRHSGHENHVLYWINLANTAKALHRRGGREHAMTLSNNLAVVLITRYETMGDTSDLERAIELHTEVLALHPPGHTKHGAALNGLANALSMRYERMGDTSDLARAIELLTDALGFCPHGHVDRGSSLNNLANALSTRYERMGYTSDLERAIELRTEALALRPPGHTDHGSSLNNLGNALCKRYGRMGDTGDLERAIELRTEALALHPPGHGYHGLSLNNLGNALSRRYERMGDTNDLARAIELHTQALALRPPGHRDRSSSLSALANDLDLRYERMGDTTSSDLARAIELHTEALGLRPHGHVDRSLSLNDLAGVLSTRYQRMGDTSDLERAIELRTEALALRPFVHDSSLNNLANVLSVRYQRMGDTGDLERVIELHTEALALRPPGHGGRSQSLHNLGDALSTRYQRMGDTSDLERAIELHTEALALRPPGHGGRSSSLDKLASALSTRYERMGDTGDLECAIELHTEALALFPPGHQARGSFLNNLAGVLTRRNKGMGETSDIECAIKLYTEALALCPPSHADRGLVLNNLASAHSTRYERMGDTGDLECAIELHTEALALSPSGLGGRETSLNNLANALSMRFNRTRDPTDLEQSIKLYTEALELIPLGDVRHASSIVNLSTALWRTENSPKDKVFGLLREGSKDFSSSLDESLRCAYHWVHYGREVDDHANLSDAYDSVIDLLQHHLPIWPTVKLQYNALCQQIGILQFPMDAAAHAIVTGDVERAVELLDVGRSLLWSELRRFREPLLQLELLDKKLAEEFETICLRLQNISTVEAQYDNPLAPSSLKSERNVASSGNSYDVLLRQKRELVERYNILLRRIKETKGLEGFLERLSFEELRAAAKEGPVIIVSCSDSEYGSHAIIVFADRPPSLIRLEESFRGTAFRLFLKLIMVTRQGPSDSFARDLKETTMFLWDDVVEDVVEKLKEEGVPEGSRIWWCPTSFLTMLPFHAAGNKKSSLVDFYISSYTPTLKALIDARNPSSSSAINNPDPRQRILVVAQSQESSKLPSVSEELKVMSTGKLGSFVECLDQDKATKEAVLEHLGSYDWAHFTCHGTLSSSPFDSSLVLYDGKLSFNDIIKARLPDAKFAFLSACHTASHTSSRLPDEVLHFAGAMFFSGFRSVVGTMWQMRDVDGPDVAKKFYDEMFREDDTAPQKPRHTRAAHALWKVTKELREKKEINDKGKEVPIEMDRWVNFIHIGA